MIKLSPDQCEEFRSRDMKHFVRSVFDQFAESRSKELDQPDRAAAFHSMSQAFEFAIRSGFTSTPHLIRLMFLAGDIHGVHNDQAVRTYLLRPGATPEQRLDDLLAVVNHKLKGME